MSYEEDHLRASKDRSSRVLDGVTLTFQNNLRGIDSFEFAFVRRNLERLRDGFKAVKLMGDRRSQLNSARGHKSHGMFQMCLSADIRKQIAQASFPQKIDVHLEWCTKPGDADELTA